MERSYAIRIFGKSPAKLSLGDLLPRPHTACGAFFGYAMYVIFAEGVVPSYRTTT